MKLEKELTPDAIKAYEERQKVLEKIVAENNTEQEAQREILAAAQDATEKAEQIITKAQSERNDAILVIRKAQEAVHLAEAEQREIKADLERNEYNCKYNALLKEQTPFWEAATTRLEKIQSELRDELPDFADFLSPGEAMENLKTTTERNAFTQFAVNVRTVEGHYQNLLQDLVKDKLNGVQIRLARHQERNALLDRFLKDETIEKIWNKG